jgi:hypothetical protein
VYLFLCVTLSLSYLSTDSLSLSVSFSLSLSTVSLSRSSSRSLSLCLSDNEGIPYCDPGEERRNKLTGWVDGNFAADPDMRKLMTGYLFSLNG